MTKPAGRGEAGRSTEVCGRAVSARSGLPVGAQLLGPSRSEERLIALAAQLEDDLRWYEHRPRGRDVE
ncbi:hypothetical protein I3W98_28870 [Streptomyces cavourensis]|nr:hypothetical protein [Streptomyces cavourensis]